MGCNCVSPTRTSLWTSIPEYRQPTEMFPGENIDCYMARAGEPTGRKDDPAPVPPGKIADTSIGTDLNGNVNEPFHLTPESPDPAVTWRVWFDGQPGVPSGMGLNFNTSTGLLDGQVADSFANKNYKVKVEAFKGGSELIDSKEYNLFPKKGESKEETVKFVWPYSPGKRVTSPFGPRQSPTKGASSDHKGIDISQASSDPGDILSAGDGTVVSAGPRAGYGNAVVIEHRDSKGTLVATTLYGHMKTMYVTAGQKVSAGQKIALEGSEGVGTAMHLHFEFHKGKFGNPVDPMPYLNGQDIQVAKDNVQGKPEANDPAKYETKTQTDRGITAKESSSAGPCPDVPPGQPTPSTPEPADAPAVPPDHQNTTPNSKDCAPKPPKDSATVQADMARAMSEDPSLTDEDKKFLNQTAKIESNLNAGAKNPSSSATGLYQMLDKTADAYYAKAGVPATCENRCDPYASTKAMIPFYKEMKKYWNDFNSSGKTKIAGKTLAPDVAARYAGLTQGEFMYGLIHHDGVGNAVVGKDLGGIAYWQKKVRGG